MTEPVSMNFGGASSPDINRQSHAKEKNTTRDTTPLISVARWISLSHSLEQRKINNLICVYVCRSLDHLLLYWILPTGNYKCYIGIQSRCHMGTRR